MVSALKPYGDTWGDGQMQLSFTLPLPAGPKAQEAAKRLAGKMGLDNVQIVHTKDLNGFTFFILYGSCRHSIDPSELPELPEEEAALSFEEINALIEERVGRKIVVVGACTGTDAHTVGLDAIMNMKGYKGEYGLERYPMFETYNLGSQVPNEELLQKAVEVGADAVLVSQVVTQRDIHIKNLTELVELAEAEGLRPKLIMVVGGPRIDRVLAAELGFDAGFGPGTTARDVAGFLAREVARRMERGE
ncbi:MAG TPA: OAM dimerization domain-containing protein [Limnochordia bacterium]|nr:OAM dimerization domain-containing protein [Limnochordia bacterium]